MSSHENDPPRRAVRRPPAVVVSCEHAGNEIPREYAPSFHVPAEVLWSHRGWDPGSEELGRELAAAFDAPLVVNRVTRLLLDANRSESNPGRVSTFARALPEELLRRAERDVWAAHRSEVERRIEAAAADGAPVLHLAAHSFTPVLDGRPRDVDVGLLYDPSRPRERATATAWCRELVRERPDLRIRRNAPYRGVSDGLPRHFRARWDDAQYAGIEVEVSQRFPQAASSDDWSRLLEAIVGTLHRALRDA